MDSTRPGGVRTLDYHTGGEPFRIVTEVPPLAGDTVAARRVAAARDPAVDGLRRLLCSEPRGHADMYGGFVVEPDDAGADLGVLFWHKDGFSTACGHGTIALGTWALHSGRVREDASGVTKVTIDVPSGRVVARVHSRVGVVSEVDFVSVPSFVMVDSVGVATSVGDVEAAVCFGGAIYASVDAEPLGLSVAPRELPRLIALAREIQAELGSSGLAEHPQDDRLSGIYGVIFVEELAGQAGAPLRQRNVTVFADGEVDRSPCGSGTAARVALLDARGLLAPGAVLVHESIVGSVFVARVESRTTVAGRDAVVPVVTGRAYRTGEHLFTVDPDDPLTPGFVLR